MPMNGMHTSRTRILIPAGLMAIALIAIAPPSADASSRTAQQAQSKVDTIHGIVFDSLLHQPIPNATVQADDGANSTSTDKEGRFTLISPTTIRKVTVFHDFLDRSGLGSLQADVTPQTSRAMMIMSTPSLATIWGRLCPGMTLEKGRNGIVFGTVRAADAKTRLYGAQVRVTWDFNAPGTRGAAARASDTKTDVTGSYYACGAPPNNNVYVAGYSSTLKSGAITVPGDTLPLRRVDLVLGEVGKTSSIRGIVRDPNHQPLVGATIDVDGVDASAKTDANGRFRIASLPTGSRTIAVRALGFAPMFQTVTVLEQDNEEVQVDMLATALRGVNVTAKNVSPLQLDYEQRKREGFGTFKDSTEIVRHTSIRSIFQGIPSLVITGPDAQNFFLYTPIQTMATDNPAGGCPANVYIDGNLSDTRVLVTLAKEQIAAIEVYIRQEFAPARYIMLTNNCGIVLVWTKLQFNKKR
jgi:hypothetical protein